jgi:hypothetical protein
MIRELLIAALQATLSLADAEAAQTFNVLGGVEAPTPLITTGQGQGSGSFAKPEPRGRDV